MKRLISMTLALFILGLDFSRDSWAVEPIHHYHDLVAGEQDPGFRDGSFTEALFHDPQGLALSPDDHQLYVADSANNAIRIVHLDQDNRVETLTGGPVPGFCDGGFTKARFDHPTALVFLGPDRLAVDDKGNGVIRVLDLRNRQVTSLGTFRPRPQALLEGDISRIDLSGIWNLAYLPQENALYFSQPKLGLLRKMDLRTNWVSVLLKTSRQVPQPAALCVFQNRLCVADLQRRNVYVLGSTAQDGLLQVGQGTDILALAARDDRLYAFQSGPEPLARLNPYHALDLPSVWGFWLKSDRPMVDPFWRFASDESPGLVADSLEDRKLYAASVSLQSVIDFQDYDYDGITKEFDWNKDDLSDYGYPTVKPPRTFRILVLGDSQLIAANQSLPVSMTGFPPAWTQESRTWTLPKRLELFLNTRASLENAGESYQVLTMAQPDSNSFLLWSYYWAPPEVQRFNVDEVFLFVTSLSTHRYEESFLRPWTKEGIPGPSPDPEFLMAPYDQRIQDPTTQDFLKRCILRGLVQTSEDKTQLTFAGIDQVITQPQLREELEEIVGRPLGFLGKKLSGSKTQDGKPVAFFICYAAGGERGEAPQEDYRSFWKELCGQQGIRFLDLTDPWVALKTTYYPTNDSCCHDHYDAYGGTLLGEILAEELIQDHLVPFNPH